MVNTVKFSEFAKASLGNPTNSLVGVTAPLGGANMQIPFPLSWDISTRPITPNPGTLGYNTSLSQLEFWNGAAWIQLAAGGSGTVSLGAQNEIAFYPANGTTVDGLTSANNAGLFTNGSGVPSMVVSTGTGSPVRNNSPSLTNPNIGVATADSIEFSTTDGIIGTTTNDNASAGSVGELVSSVIPSSSAVPLTNNIISNVTSIILHAGDWDVWGNVSFQILVNVAQYAGWINNVSATFVDPSLLSFLNITSMGPCGFSVLPRRISLSTITTIYLSAHALFAGTPGQVNVCGGIYARVRR